MKLLLRFFVDVSVFSTLQAQSVTVHHISLDDDLGEVDGVGC